MKNRMMKKTRLTILAATITTSLVGCGTLGRGGSYEQTYRGVDTDKKEISNAFLWLPSLGLWPLFHIISLPVDAVIDTVLLPVDLSLKPTPTEDHTQASIIMPVFAVNMTNTPDFNYTIQNKRSGEVLTKGTTSKIPQTGSRSPTLDIVSVLTRSNPSPRIDSVEIKWQASQPTLLSNHSSGTATFVETRTPTDDLRGSGSIIALFMPCNTVMVINSERPFYNADFINQKAIQDSYKQLTNMAEHSQCTQAVLVNPVIEHTWK
jgi:uncharacterized protein YceK